MSDEERMGEWLIDWEERFDQGVDTPADVLCQDRPDLAEPLGKRIAALKRMKKRLEANGRQRDTGQQANVGAGKGRDDPGRSASSNRYPGAEPIPGYRLVEKIGSGAFGEVWRASSGRKKHAMKFFHGDLHASDSRGRIVRELEGLTRIMEVDHDLILKIESLKVKDGSLVLITELADLSLEKLFVRCRDQFPMVRRCAYALGLLQNVAEVLDHLQARHGLLHLDIKPANLLLVRGVCKIGDFGTVFHFRSGQPPAGEVLLSLPSPDDPGGVEMVRVDSLSADSQESAFLRGATLVTAAGVFTPRFAPPEAFRGKTSRSFDQYSLALTFCELVAGRIPFEGESQFTRRIQGEMETEFLPEPLRGVIGRALQPEPERRFPSCVRFIDSLRTAIIPLVKRDVVVNDWRGWLLEMEEAAGTESPEMPPGTSENGVNRGKTTATESIRAAVGTKSPEMSLASPSGWLRRKRTTTAEKVLVVVGTVFSYGFRTIALVAEKSEGLFWAFVRHIRNSSIRPILSLVAVVLMCLALASIHRHWFGRIPPGDGGAGPKKEKEVEQKNNPFAVPFNRVTK